ncbi:5075_t:CDS:1, partial [Cetraspora pellucida]
ATSLQKPEISYVKLTSEMVAQFEEFFSDKVNINSSSYKTESNSELFVLYLYNTKKNLWEKFSETYLNSI